MFFMKLTGNPVIFCLVFSQKDKQKNSLECHDLPEYDKQAPTILMQILNK